MVPPFARLLAAELAPVTVLDKDRFPSILDVDVVVVAVVVVAVVDPFSPAPAPAPAPVESPGEITIDGEVVDKGDSPGLR